MLNRTHMNKSSVLSLLFFLIVKIVTAQSLDKSDYARAVSFLWENVNNKKAFNLHVTPNWFTDSTGFWYVHYSKNEKLYNKVTIKPMQKSVLFDHVQVAERLGSILQKTVDPKNLDLENVR
ncbi:MAG: hypothetical protein OEU76_01805, partial [Cyclobacteriaceae bacterium]|nr:hypothetical protein [Cyclobacteriaceae bacterium]